MVSKNFPQSQTHYRSGLGEVHYGNLHSGSVDFPLHHFLGNKRVSAMKREGVHPGYH